MILVVPVIGALAMLLLLSGLPIVRRRRMVARVEPYVSGIHGRPSRLLAGSSSHPVGIGRWIEGALPRTGAADERLTGRLAAADLGFTPSEFRVRQVSWGIGCVVGSWILLGLAAVNGMKVNLTAMPALGLAALVLGWLGRDWWLSHQIEERREVLHDELPTAIDLITLSILAGESIAAAFARVAGILPSAIGTELRRVLADVRAGETVVNALETLKSRIPDYGIARFVDALITGIESGAPLADVLRAQADDVRESRRRRLIELGGKREVLMLVPVVFLIMPVVVVYALLPGLVSLNLIVP